MKTYFYLYKVTNLINNKYYYGVHKTQNLNDGYMGSGKYLRNAIIKYGLEHFTKDIICFCESSEEMYQLEKEIVTLDLLSDQNCYNIATGGNGGWHHVDPKKGRDAANKILCQMYGEQWNSILGSKGVETNRINKTGIFAEGHINPFSLKEYNQLGNTPEARAKASITSKKTFKEINHQQGSKNSQFGTCWITNGIDNKKIKKDDISTWMELGWILGRNIKSKRV